MRRSLLLMLSLLGISCAHAPPAPITPLADTCNELARKLDKTSNLGEADKRKLVEQLASSPFTWKLRLLSLSDQTNPQDMNPPVMADMECADRPRDANDGMRYLFTVYFDGQFQSQFAEMSRGTLLEVQGNLSSYEGRNAFAAKGKTFKKGQ